MLPADSPFASPPAPGPHPATPELRAYAAGTLSAADEHRIEAHTLDCERCAELLEGFSMSDAATTDQALAGLRARLQARVADDLAEPIVLPASRPLWPRLAAGVALLGAVGAGLWGWEHQQPSASTVASTTSSKTTAPAKAPSIAQSEPAASASATPKAEPQSAADASSVATATARQPTEYAATRPTSTRGKQRPLRQPVPPVAAVLADQTADTPTADNWGSQEHPAAVASQLNGRVAGVATVAAAPAATPAAVVAEESDAKAMIAAAPARAKKASAVVAADSSSPQLASLSRFNAKAKDVESSALVRVADKPMPMVPTIAPAPVEGTPALRSYLHREATKFEPKEGEKPINGVVRVRFTVEADGKLSNIQVVRGMRADYDAEALRLICEGPAWRPGIAGGRRAALPVEITVSF